MSTIVFHHGALGDSVLNWPLLRGHRGVTLIGSWGKVRLTERWVAGVRGLDGESPDFSRLFGPGGECEVGDGVKRLLRDARLVISFVSDGRDAWARNVGALASCVVFVPSRPPAGHVEHVVRFHARLLGERGVDVQPASPPRRINPDGPVVVHPGSGGREKCWPADRFDRLLTHLEAIGRPARVVIGEAERERMDRRMLEKWRRERKVVEPDGLIELSELIARAAVFIGNDSGPTHLAAQLGVPTVAMFGPTDPRIWAPVGPEVRVLHPPTPRSMEWLDVERVAEAAARY